jgi:surface antigen
MKLNHKAFIPLAVLVGFILSLSALSPAHAQQQPNCVLEVQHDSYWSRHYDAFSGAQYARDFANTARSRDWIVDGSPEVGDVAVWTGGAGAPGARAESYGHVAVVVDKRGGDPVVREQNWPLGASTATRQVKLASGISFVHRRKWVTTTKTESIQTGSRSVQYVSSWRSEQYVSSYRTEQYTSGWRDNWVVRNGRRVNDRQPILSTRRIPVYSTRNVPVYSTKNEPVFTTRTIQTRTIQNVN